MKKRYLTGIVMLTAAMLGACSGQKTTTETSKVDTTEVNTESEKASTETPGGVIEIEFWHALENQYEATLNKVVDEFNKTHTDISVKPVYVGAYAALNEAIVASNAAGTGLPGVAMANIPYVAGYGSSNLCEDLGPYIERDGFEIDDFGEGLVKAAKYGDTQVALPFLVSTEVVFYNKDMASELGVEIPEKWDDMPAFLEKASVPGERYGMAIPGWNTWYYEPFFINNGVKMVTDENTTDFASEKGIQVVNTMKDWCDAGYTYLAVGEDAASEMRQKFLNGETLSVIYTSSLYNTMVETCPFEVGMTWLPSGDTKIQELGGNVLFIPAKNSQEVKDASWEFLSYLMGKDVNMIWASESGYLPTRKSVQDTEEGKEFLESKPAFQVIFDNLDLIDPGIQRSDWSQITAILKNYVEEIIEEDLDVEDSLKEMEAEINEILSDS
ncbi:MAG: ABC transporter substrate-binding protein [Eubacteriales bacterium]|nr:ABC transporter substrate-binding protein [Eubacteriales bacterium]